MKDLLVHSKTNTILTHNDLTLLANAIPEAFILVNHEGVVIFANAIANKICKSNHKKTIPFLPYSQYVDTSKSALFDIFDETFVYKKDLTRQFVDDKKIFLVETKTVLFMGTFQGFSVTIEDITQNIFREKQHELLYQISSALSGVSGLHQLLKLSVTQILHSMNVASVNIMLYDNTRDVLVNKVDTRTNGDTPSREFRLGEGLAGRAAEELKPYSVYDIKKSKLFIHPREEDRGALLVVPMASRGRLLGVINIRDDAPRYFTESEVQFLTIVANDIAIALENSFLYERLNQKIKLLSKLFWISSFTGVKTLDSRIQRIVRLIAELLDANDCCIYIYSPSRNKLVLRYQKDLSSPLPLQIDLNQNSLSRTVLMEQETVVLNDFQNSSQPTIFKKYPKVRNIICTPLHVNQKEIGVLHVINKHNGKFDEEDKHLLTITAHRVGTIIENAQLIRKVEAEKDLLDNIIKYTSEGVAVLNSKKRIIIWNQYLEQLTGLNSNEIVGLPSYKILFSQLKLKKLTQLLYTPLSEGSLDSDSALIEEEMMSSTGEKIWLGCVYSHLFDNNRNVEYTIIVFRNISKDKEFIQAKNEFVSLATHELRTPLTAIKGYLSMILHGDSGEISPKQKDYFNKAYLATERLVSLVEELLDVVRIDENKMKFDVRPFLLNPVIEDCIDIFAIKARAKNVTIQFKAVTPMQVHGDLDKTKQIVCNLIDNAVKYTRDRGKIVIALEKKEHEVVITVSDTGVGIPEKNIPSIFDRFVRIPNPLSIKAGGTGLGLYIVKSLVEKQGGKIWVTSQPNKETIFYFTLPLAATSPVIQEREEPK